jgi:hypothetical protein
MILTGDFVRLCTAGSHWLELCGGVWALCVSIRSRCHGDDARGDGNDDQVQRRGDEDGNMVLCDSETNAEYLLVLVVWSKWFALFSDDAGFTCFETEPSIHMSSLAFILAVPRLLLLIFRCVLLCFIQVNTIGI